MQEHKNDKICTGEHYSLFVVHVATTRLDSFDTDSLHKVERVKSCRNEPSGIWA